MQDGDVTTGYYPSLHERNNYFPYCRAVHSHESRYKFKHALGGDKVETLLGEKKTPISIGRARLSFGNRKSRWDQPSLVGHILMTKPEGGARPESFPRLKEEKRYRPRYNNPDSALRTLYRFGQSQNPERIVQQDSSQDVNGLSPKPTGISLMPVPNQFDASRFRAPEPEYDVRSGTLPRGLIVLCKQQLDPAYPLVRPSRYGFHGGFPFPSIILKKYQISRQDWDNLCKAMDEVVRPYSTNSPVFGHIRDGYKRENIQEANIPELVDQVLDIAAKWDRYFFRPRGLLMRLDMPGEARFGLNTMDIFHKKKGDVGHIDNCHGAISQKVTNFEKSKMDSPKLHHLTELLQMAFSRTRIVLDEISVLKDTRLAYERGWMVWNASCHWAKELETFPKKFPSGLPAARADRWPRSKHIYYDRFIGHPKCIAKEFDVEIPHTTTYNAGTKHEHRITTYTREKRINPHGKCSWIPGPESMDQRLHMFGTRGILPADCAPVRIDAILSSFTKTRDSEVYWEDWAMDILEQDGYYDEQLPLVGAVHRKSPIGYVIKSVESRRSNADLQEGSRVYHD